MSNKKDFSVIASIIIASAAVIAGAVHLFIIFSNRRIFPVVIAQAFLCYAYPVCGAVIARRKKYGALLLYVFGVCFFDFVLSVLAYPLSLLYRELYFSFINACNAELRMAITGVWIMRYPVYIFLCVSLAVFYVSDIAAKRIYVAHKRILFDILIASLQSFLTVILFDFGIAVSIGFSRYRNIIIDGIILISCIISAVVLYQTRRTTIVPSYTDTEKNTDSVPCDNNEIH